MSEALGSLGFPSFDLALGHYTRVIAEDAVKHVVTPVSLHIKRVREDRYWLDYEYRYVPKEEG